MSLLLVLTNFGNLLNSCELILYTNKVFEGINPLFHWENLANLKMPGYYVIDFLISCHVMLLIKGKRSTVSEWEDKLFVSIAGVTSHPIPLCAAAAFM